MLPKYYVDYGKTIFHFYNLKRKLRIVGLDGMNLDDLLREIQNGEKFIVYKYSIFVLFAYMKGISPIYFTKDKAKLRFALIRYTLLTLAFMMPAILCLIFFVCVFLEKILSHFDWFLIGILAIIVLCIAIPFSTLIKNFRGGLNVTEDVLQYIKNEMSAVK